MLLKTMMILGMVGLSLSFFSCMGNNSSEDPQQPATTDTAKTYGSFQVSLMALDGYTSVVGSITNGPEPIGTIWDEVQAVGPCKLFKPRIPFCEQSCGSNYVCVEDDSCMIYPQLVSAGTVTMTGVKKNDGTTTITVNPMNFMYQPVGVAYPPFAEGDVVTVSTPGSVSVPAFTLSTKGISPLVVSNETIVMADGQPINLQWTPPGLAGNSIISIYVDISHHGGMRGKIECECDDNGSYSIPAVLLDKLKTFGISGYPKIVISRKSIGTTSATNATLIIESSVTKILDIPGVVSCESDEECPDGQSCGQDFMCR